MAQDNRMIKQHELLQSALNYNFTSISGQSVVDIFGQEEAPKQIKKLSILGIRLFDANDMDARKQAAESYIQKQNQALYYERSRFDI